MEAAEERFLESTRQIFRSYHNRVSVRKTIKSMQDQDISSELVEAIYNQLSEDAEKAMADRFHYYSIKFEPDLCERGVNTCWTNRYLVTYDSYSNSDGIKITDVFNDTSMKISFKKDAQLLIRIVYLKDGFGLLQELGDSNSFISLIVLDISRCSLQKLHTVEYPSDYIGIIADKADPTTFLVNDYNRNANTSRTCKIVENKIIIGDVARVDFDSSCFYDKCVYGLKWYYRDHIRIPQIAIYNVEEKTENRIDLNLPVGYTANYTIWLECVRCLLFIRLECKNGTTVISYLNIQTHQLNILDFSLPLGVSRITWFEKDNLIVHTDSNDYEIHDFYKIPFGNPDLLENTAWFSLVKIMKKRETVDNPYEAARKYLPPNSTINCPFKNLE